MVTHPQIKALIITQIYQNHSSKFLLCPWMTKKLVQEPVELLNTSKWLDPVQAWYVRFFIQTAAWVDIGVISYRSRGLRADCSARNNTNINMFHCGCNAGIYSLHGVWRLVTNVCHLIWRGDKNEWGWDVGVRLRVYLGRFTSMEYAQGFVVSLCCGYIIVPSEGM